MTLREHFFPEKKEAFSKNKKGTSLLISKSWGVHAPSAPGSYVYDRGLMAIKTAGTLDQILEQIPGDFPRLRMSW